MCVIYATYYLFFFQVLPYSILSQLHESFIYRHSVLFFSMRLSSKLVQRFLSPSNADLRTIMVEKHKKIINLVYFMIVIQILKIIK